MAKYDLMVAFNSHQLCWFQGEPADMFSSDFESVALHEILHALGFGAAAMSYLEQVGGENSPLVSPGYDEFARGSAPAAIASPFDLSSSRQELRFYYLMRPTIFDRFLRIADTTSPSGSTAMDFLAKMQANLDRLIKAGAVQQLSPDAAKAASDRLDLTPEEKELAANTTQVAYSPTDIKSALVKDAETNALMAAMHTTVTTPSTVHFAFSAWPPAAAQLSRLLPDLNLTSPLTLETSLTPFSASSLAHVQRSQAHIAFDRDAQHSRRVPTVHDLGPEFIMWASGEPVPLHDMCVISGVPSGIGLKTLATLVALGYTPATADTWVSRREVAELVREEVPVGLPLGPPIVLDADGIETVVRPRTPPRVNNVVGGQPEWMAMVVGGAVGGFTAMVLAWVGARRYMQLHRKD